MPILFQVFSESSDKWPKIHEVKYIRSYTEGLLSEFNRMGGLVDKYKLALKNLLLGITECEKKHSACNMELVLSLDCPWIHDNFDMSYRLGDINDILQSYNAYCKIKEEPPDRYTVRCEPVED
jgi:hypothetical protein